MSHALLQDRRLRALPWRDRDCLGPTDVEGATARLTAARSLLGGIAFPIALHAAAWRRGARLDRRWIGGELALTVLLVGLAAHGALPLLSAHVAAMMAAQLLVGFFAVWTVHHDVDVDRQLARTMRHPLKSAVALGMFFHLEHHLYPRVPTCRLPTLAGRLGHAAPQLGDARVY